MGARSCEVIFLNQKFIIYVFIIYHRPENKRELFNLRHAQLRNEIERIFGVLKRRFRILLLAPEYSLEIQARLPVALAAVHNFILYHEPLDQPEATTEGNAGAEVHGRLDPDHRASSMEAEDDEEGDERRETIANAMWEEYVVLRRRAGIPVAGDVGSDVDMEDDLDDLDDLDDGGFERIDLDM